MHEPQKKPDNDVDALLAELEHEEVPAMTATFEAQSMYRIAQRKKELDEGEKPAKQIRKGRTGWKAWIAVAAIFIFLFGGTLLTRESYRQPDYGISHTIQPMTMNPISENQVGVPVELPDENQTTLFFEDMWLFLRASLPWLGGAGILTILLCLVKAKKKDK